MINLSLHRIHRVEGALRRSLRLIM
jgi:hypothetical protein